MKKVVIITSSMRENSNSSLLSQAFQEGAESTGNEVTVVSLKKNRMTGCMGCGYCQIHGECIIKDKLNETLDQIIDADVLVFASPTYYYSISGTLKNFIDRAFAKFTRIQNKDFYYIGSCTDGNKEAIDRCVVTVQGFLDCVSNVHLKGVVYGTSLTDEGDAKYSDALKEAYEMGKAI
ncbi:MAG: flavodoxin family protein [Bacilli bacterium]|nr:flavodoxin family protein [Bacilli bacterium]